MKNKNIYSCKRVETSRTRINESPFGMKHRNGEARRLLLEKVSCRTDFHIIIHIMHYIAVPLLDR